MDNYKLQKTTIWSFPDRGNWSTHKGDYRGNWSPHIPRNLILKYTAESDTVLDCFLGSGTTLIECKILNRNAIGIDINPTAINISTKRLAFKSENNSYQELFNASADNLHMIESSSIDLNCTHPPYANIIKYSNNQIIGDLSNYNHSIFLEKLNSVAKELYRVLKQNKHCAIMIGDIRKNGIIVPLGFLTMQVFQNTGFKLKDIVIKEQHNCKSSNYWLSKSSNLDFYLLAHEYIFIFKK